MIHEAYMPVYMGSRFLARDGRDGTGRTEVVQEALADLKIDPKMTLPSSNFPQEASQGLLSPFTKLLYICED